MYQFLRYFSSCSNFYQKLLKISFMSAFSSDGTICLLLAAVFYKYIMIYQVYLKFKIGLTKLTKQNLTKFTKSFTY